MRIIVDYRPALRARTGVGEYMHEITRAFTSMFTDDVAVFTSSWKDRPRPEVASELRVSVIDARVPVRVLNLLWHRAGWPPVEWLAGACDVVHAAHPLIIPARRAAEVVTVHDLYFLDRPERTHGEIRRDYPALTADHARRADAVVTPSEYTRRQVVSRLGVPADRVHVCSLGAPAWKTLGDRPHAPADGVFLFMGTLDPRKNIEGLLDGYEGLLRRRTDAPPLVLAGGAGPEAGPWLARLATPALAGKVRHVGYVQHGERESWYARARALILPSWDEGFGLPVLEAMAAGIPVVVSNRGALPEVAGDAAIPIDPDDTASLTDALDRLAADPGWARERGAAALDQAATYTWAKTATRLRGAYTAAIARRREKGPA